MNSKLDLKSRRKSLGRLFFNATAVFVLSSIPMVRGQEQVGSQGTPFQQLQRQLTALAARVAILEDHVAICETALEEAIETIRLQDETLEALRQRMVFDSLTGNWVGFDELRLTGRTVFSDRDSGGLIVIHDPLNAAINVFRPPLSNSNILQVAMRVNGIVEMNSPPTLIDGTNSFIPTLTVGGETVLNAHQPIRHSGPALRVTGPSYFRQDNSIDAVQVSLATKIGNNQANAVYAIGPVLIADGSAESPFRALSIFSSRSDPFWINEFNGQNLRFLMRMEADPESASSATLYAERFIETPTP